MPAPAMTTTLRCFRRVLTSRSICDCCSSCDKGESGVRSSSRETRSLGTLGVAIRRRLLAGGLSWRLSSSHGGGEGKKPGGAMGEDGGELSSEASEKSSSMAIYGNRGRCRCRRGGGVVVVVVVVAGVGVRLGQREKWTTIKETTSKIQSWRRTGYKGNQNISKIMKKEMSRSE